MLYFLLQIFLKIKKCITFQTSMNVTDLIEWLMELIGTPYHVILKDQKLRSD